MKHLGRAGFTLVEILAAAGITAVVGVGTLALMQNVIGERTRAESKQSLVQIISITRSNMNRSNSLYQCKNVLSFTNHGAVQVPGKTPVTITSDVLLTDGGVVKGLTPFRVDHLYILNPEQVSTSATQTTYVGSLIIEASIQHNGNWESFPARELTTIATNVDTVGHFIDCDLGLSQADNQTSCNELAGMVWNQALSRCVQTTAQTGNLTFSTCPSGAAPDANGVCAPPESHCDVSNLPQGFNSGIVSGCNTLTTDYVIITDPSDSQLGVAAPTPPVPSSPPTTAAPQITNCTCGNTTISFGQYCVMCTQDSSGTWPMSLTVNNFNLGYLCQSDGNLSTPAVTSSESTSVGHTCSKMPTVGSCSGSPVNCHQ